MVDLPPGPAAVSYNDNDCTGQKANPDGTNMYGDVSFFLQNGVPCNTIGIQTVDAPDMHLVELDWPDGDDVVGSLTYSGSIDIPLTCSNSYLCRGDSAWLSASNDTVSADVQIRVRTYFYHGGSDR